MPKRFFILFILIIPFLLNAQDVKDLLNKGDEAYNKFNNIEAINYYEKAYRQTPDNYDVLFRLSRTYNDAGEELKDLNKKDEAESYMNKALDFSQKFVEQYPDSAAAYSFLAVSYGNVALFKGSKEKVKYAHKVEDNAKKAMSLNPDFYLPYLILGIYNREIASLSWLERTFANAFFGNVPQGSYEASKKYLTKALEIKPELVDATYELAKTYGELDNEEKEVELLQKVLKMPNHSFRDKYVKTKSKALLKDLE